MLALLVRPYCTSIYLMDKITLDFVDFDSGRLKRESLWARRSQIKRKYFEGDSP